MVRRRIGGGYFTILTPPEGATRTKRVAFRSSYVHIAVGYPGLKFPPDLVDYRETHRDYGSVVNAYEPLLARLTSLDVAWPARSGFASTPRGGWDRFGLKRTITRSSAMLSTYSCR
jgi:hypothetical protein